MNDSKPLLELITHFNQLTTAQDRYRELILLSKKLPTMDAQIKNTTPPIEGCESGVWINLKIDENNLVHIDADSDSRIIKGVLYILIIALQRQEPSSILEFNLDKLFEQLKISGQLTHSKENGIKLIVETIYNFCLIYVRK